MFPKYLTVANNILESYLFLFSHQVSNKCDVLELLTLTIVCCCMFALSSLELLCTCIL